VVAGDCPIMGLGSFGTRAFWGRAAPSMYGVARSNGSSPVGELLQSSLPRQGVVGVNGCRPGPAPPGVSARRVMSILCSCQRSEARQTARLRRAAGARVIRERGGNVAASGYSGEARAPKSIIQEGKKGIRSLMIVFREMQPVIGFFGEI
jgi:hypothetical protein